MHCTKCGRQAPAESVFCPHCGTRLEDSSDDDPSNAQSPGPAEFRAAGQRGSGKQPPEEDIWSGTYSPKAMYGTFLIAAILSLVGLVPAAIFAPIGWSVWIVAVILVWGCLGLLLLYRRLTVRYRLTTYRFFHEAGLLSRVRDRVEVIRIEDVSVEQQFVERMFGVGTIVIMCSSDQSHPNLRLQGIENPRDVADLIDDTRRTERNRRGMFMENV